MKKFKEYVHDGSGHKLGKAASRNAAKSAKVSAQMRMKITDKGLVNRRGKLAKEDAKDKR